MQEKNEKMFVNKENVVLLTAILENNVVCFFFAWFLLFLCVFSVSAIK